MAEITSFFVCKCNIVIYLSFICCEFKFFYCFIMIFGLFPGDGGWGHWSNWTECTKSCGGGVRSHRRECDSPSPEGDGNYCEGLGTEVMACNTDHCPGTFTKCVKGRWRCGNAGSARTYWVLLYSWFCQCFDSASLWMYFQWRHARKSQAQRSVAVGPPALAPVRTWLWVLHWTQLLFPPITLTINFVDKNFGDDKCISSCPSALSVAMWAGVLLYRGKGPVC